MKIHHTPKSILVTGGAGFIGSNFVRHMLAADSQVSIVNLDKLTYAGNPHNLTGLEETYGDRYRFVHGDICDGTLVTALFDKLKFDTVVHLAAESHVDRSIDGPMDFITTNVVGTMVLLQAAREAWGDRDDVRFHHVSTDEVYGSLGDTGLFTETTSYDPSSPYSASKASSDHLVRAWSRTFGLPVTLSNCSNNYGPYQFPEKLLPVMIINALEGKALPIYGDGKNVRDWLYVEDHCRAIETVIRHAPSGETYNVGGHNEWANIDIVHLICDVLETRRDSGREGGYRSLIEFVKDRPGHDRRYAIDASKVESELGWKPSETFETGLAKTVDWYLSQPTWIEEIRSGGYRMERQGLGIGPT
ncbi:MAG: dTDP-glucose 4,6-dehydratase [Myxococcota bacterium]|nr:dTDP-glucose 4,6-dehydratase [Myxococcota bacterium]